ncbi:MAG: class B sortase [Acetatifactor sp.]|nr:class B sortase [Acetatifactor sp.]
MKFYAEDGEHVYEVIAVFESQVFYVTDQVFKYYNFFQADTVEEFNYFYDNIRELSLYDTGLMAEFGDKFLTLSTCAYHVEDGRFVVVAKEIKPEEAF